MGTYIDEDDAVNELSPTTIIALFDDGNTGTADSGQVDLTIADAEGLFDASIATQYALPLPTLAGGAIDRLIKRACKQYFRALAFGRHPEYLQGYGEKESKASYDRADRLMMSIKSAMQEMPDMKSTKRAANVGGVVYDSGPRTICDSADGTSNGGDF